jgi:histidyl-tRNA synthetase
VADLRQAGLTAELDLAGRSLKGQLKQADRVGARSTIILEADGRATLRDMSSGEQREVELTAAVEAIRSGGDG